MPAAERRDSCAEYGFPQPRLFGRGAPAAAADVVRDAFQAAECDDGECVVEFPKVAESTTDRTRYSLAGGTRDE